ncbi:succinate dehydrogenase/fumarate reductase, iron-sulfur subunit [Lebetimonas natsushimae]|uniref:Fumarate reductase iron-sulfur subunit n=1 Tax=Lebetimonas natsushimae TaxID=1936991 RepID=A0A292YCE8_9BACT|nr:succinate dehydrogenase/fumarate reductase iron-sulfur subunit [Lebetimonas natsushimae]GAX87408.1 succinate dehydrogenase/fumarate reductase, iron-sulfur subunit [Lebetimonas natsushimae]
MEKISYIARIKRYNPEKNESYWQDFEVEVEDTLTVLELLMHIKDKIDSSLTFRAFCRSAICGSCAMIINGRSGLACKIQAKDRIRNGVIKIEPLQHLPVIKDLVVDQEPAFDKLKKVKPYLIPDPKKVPDNLKSESLVSPEEFALYDKQTDCILCMACYGQCNALEGDEKYLGPFQLTKAFRFIMDSRDGMDVEERIKFVEENGIYECVQCQMCLAACPKGIKPAEDILQLRRIAKDVGEDNPATRRAKFWFQTVFETGQIDKYNLPEIALEDEGEKIKENMEEEFRERGLKEDEFGPKPFEGIKDFQNFIKKLQKELK